MELSSFFFQNMFIVNEITFNGYGAYSLYFTSLVAILFGVLVIIAKNPIVSVLFLIGLFLSISGYLILAGLNFLGLSYLLVYVGAISILFLFILMLINVRISELLIDNINSLPFVMIAASLLGIFVIGILPYIYFNFTDIILVKKTINHVTSLS
jgi:NADH-ubiquinone oxidoreductase chain 6